MLPLFVLILSACIYEIDSGVQANMKVELPAFLQEKIPSHSSLSLRAFRQHEEYRTALSRQTLSLERRCVLVLRGGTTEDGDISLSTHDRKSTLNEASTKASQAATREASYTTPFPFSELFPLTPAKLAAAGFSYMPREDCYDRSVCSSCHLALHSWKRTDDPFFEHLRWSKACPRVIGLHSQLETALATSILPGIATVLNAAPRWSYQVAANVPEQYLTLNRALRGCPFGHRMVATLDAEETHTLPTELRVAAFHELHVRAASSEQGTREEEGKEDGREPETAQQAWARGITLANAESGAGMEERGGGGGRGEGGEGGAGEGRKKAMVKGTWWMMPGQSAMLLVDHAWSLLVPCWAIR